MLAALPPAVQAQAAASDAAGTAGAGGPVRLRQPTQADTATRQASPGVAAMPAASPGDFELYVRNQAGGSNISRFGSELLVGMLSPTDGADYNPLVPPDYVLRAGDELVVTLWGSVDADLRLQVDRSGRISIPRVGPVMVSGVRYADLPDVIGRRVGQVFKNFQLSVSLGQLRGIRVYVTGFVARPGSLVVNSLSTLAQALMKAGGPSAAGSFRQIQLRRGKDVAATFDLYDLLLRGDRSADLRLEADDVIHVGPVGNQVALLGSVNRPSIFELKPDETVADLLRMAGGFSAVADGKRLAWERFADRGKERVAQIEVPASANQRLGNGDLLRAFNLADVLLPMARQNKLVRIEGEVVKPGEYVMPAESTLADALRQAGGLTQTAFLYGAVFSRQSVRATQQQNYERALRDLETDLTRTSTSARTTTADEATGQTANSQAISRLLDRLRAVKPTGRVVLQLPADGGQLPNMIVEDGDRLYVPPRPTSVGVFGSVFNTGNYLHTVGRGVNDYVMLAGGPTRGADDSSIFVVRANGSVVSNMQGGNWFSRRDKLNELKAEPGDTIFVPEEINKTTVTQVAKDWSQIFFQLAVGYAGLKSSTGF
jgi:protein involved in polysaccharide export with SLBB domain